MSVRSIPLRDSVSVGTLVSARHLLDAISHSDKNIGDLCVGGLR
ncbi:hypothetical protein [Mycobacteroides chelonae]|nr:hypothetical protein [Mycobacteroides chelonae]